LGLGTWDGGPLGLLLLLALAHPPHTTYHVATRKRHSFTTREEDREDPPSMGASQACDGTCPGLAAGARLVASWQTPRWGWVYLRRTGARPLHNDNAKAKEGLPDCPADSRLLPSNALGSFLSVSRPSLLPPGPAYGLRLRRPAPPPPPPPPSTAQNTKQVAPSSK
jgi:hypothetical protein